MTNRERVLAHLATHEQTAREIGAELQIPVRTVHRILGSLPDQERKRLHGEVVNIGAIGRRPMVWTIRSEEKP